MTVFSFYWFGKWEFGKFTNRILVIGGLPQTPAPYYSDHKSLKRQNESIESRDDSSFIIPTKNQNQIKRMSIKVIK